MWTEFHYQGFEPTERTKRKGNIAIDSILNKAPYGAWLTASLEKEGDQFRCSVELFSKYGPFAASIIDTDADTAIERVESTLLNKLSNWNRQRFSLLRNNKGLGNFRLA